MATEKIDISLYDDEVNIVFYPNSHQYKKDWKNILSVSAICWVVDKSWPLMYWATNLAKEYLLEKFALWEINEEEIVNACKQHTVKKEEAADIWSKAHNRVEEYTKTWNMTFPEDPKVANAINWFLERSKQYDIEYIHQEKFVYSKKYDYVGIVDCIAVIDWKKYLIDYKTSNAIRMLEYGMQTTAYCKAYEEQTGETIDWIIIVRFAKEEFDKKWNPIDLFEAVEIIDREWFFEAFLAAKVLKENVKKYDTWNK